MERVGSLTGRKIGRNVIGVHLADGRFSEELNFEIFLGKREVAHGKQFLGRKHYSPWIEVSFRGKWKEKILTMLCDLLPNGSHIMVEYSDDRETEEGLKHAIPAPATPLGYMLWKCGCRWFKDWYFAEGFMEGGVKLQGEKPLNAGEKRKLEAEARRELRDFIARGGSGTILSRARKRATTLLKTIRR